LSAAELVMRLGNWIWKRRRKRRRKRRNRGGGRGRGGRSLSQRHRKIIFNKIIKENFPKLKKTVFIRYKKHPEHQIDQKRNHPL